MRTTRQSIDDWGEDNGSYGRCPHCGKRTWMESGCRFECSRCGYDVAFDGAVEDEEEPEEKQQ